MGGTPPAREGGPRVLVTGAAGVLGDAIVELLPADRSRCLTHRKRLRRANRVTLRADITRPRLGLTPREYGELVRGTDLVIHSAALSHIAARPEAVREVNVEGTRHVIRLCEEAGAHLCHVGTALTPAGGDEADASSERFAWEPYLRTKQEAEQLVLSSGLPSTVARTSLIVGDSRGGAIPRFQGLYALAGLLLRDRFGVLAVPPEAPVDFLPRDLLARYIIALAERGPRDEPVTLTAGPSAPNVREVVEVIIELGRDLGIEVPDPRFVPPEMIDRLVRPVFLPALPENERRRFEYVIEYTRPLCRIMRLDTSLPQLSEELGLPGAPDAQRTLRLSLEYWAERQQWLRRRAADDEVLGAA
jgi:nucleoside-diphosphate-sugar epimerase